MARRGVQPRRITVVRYYLADGTRVASGTPGAIRRKEKSDTWYAKIGGKRVSLETTDLQQAWIALRNKLRQQADTDAGITDDFQDQARRPLGEHLAEWLKSVGHKGTSTAQVELMRARVDHLAGWKRLAHVAARSCLSALSHIQLTEGLSAQTRNHYLRHAKQFTRWLVESGRLRTDPLAGLKPVNIDVDRRRDRRDFSDEELVYLFAFVRGAPPRSRISGPDREMLYLTSLYTGLRASELASLTPESFSMESDPPTVTVEAAYSKHRRRDVVPLHGDLVRQIRPWLSERSASARLWPGVWASQKRAAKMLKRDLTDARKQWLDAQDAPERARREKTTFLAFKDADGRQGDFHALRHTFITRLVRAGVRPKDAQTLARHSTITLTMDRYAHTTLADTAAATNMVPSLQDPAEKKGKKAR